jgi:protein-L-isoaspartate(D-aspartate) O-methyltransferase
METTEPIKEPGEVIRREDFLPPDLKELASLNEALPIGYGQTISQPLVVGFMLELLEPKRGQKILDIGAGSGWTTALLAHIVGTQGQVIALELIPEIAEFGKNNVGKYNFINEGIVKYLCQDGSKGYINEAPYDRILASASLAKKELPLAWREQVKIGGKIVVPIQNSIWVFTKKDEKQFQEQEYPGFVFVSFVS